MSILRKIRKYLSLDTRKTFYNYHVKPHLNYCSSIWGQTTKENLNKIQKQAARLILDKGYFTPSAEMFSKLQWQNFADNVQWQMTNDKWFILYKPLGGVREYKKNIQVQMCVQSASIAIQDLEKWHNFIYKSCQIWQWFCAFCVQQLIHFKGIRSGIIILFYVFFVTSLERESWIKLKLYFKWSIQTRHCHCRHLFDNTGQVIEC